MLDFKYNKNTDTYDCTIDTASTYVTFMGESWADSFGGWIIETLVIEDMVGNVYESNGWNNEIHRDSYFEVKEQEKWHINEITDKSTHVSGVTEKYATVTIKIGEKEYTEEADIKGKFKIQIPQQEGATPLTVIVKNVTDTEIQNIKLTVKDYDAPEEPVVTTIVTDKTTQL